ncbi:hypothetical protein KKC59_00145 [bacterium]|nr:hypothetical protein [bacterium]
MNKKLFLSKFIIWTFFCFYFCSNVWAEVSKSDKFSLLSANVVQEKSGRTSGKFILSQDLTKEVFVAELAQEGKEVDVGFLYTLAFPLEEEALTDIASLNALTYPLGVLITERVWQKDRDPYFYWELTKSSDLILGYSIDWNIEPDDSINTTDMFYQVPNDYLQDGKFVFGVKAINKSGSPGQPFYYEIWVDSTPPGVISVSPKSGDYLSDKVPEIKLEVIDELSGINKDSLKLNINGSSVDAVFDKENGVVSYKPINDLPEGKNTIRFWCYDIVGNKSAEFTSNFYIDSIPPTGSIVINEGVESTYSFFVDLKISAQDTMSGVKDMMVSNLSDFSDVSWESYSTEKKQWQLSSFSGFKTVYVKFRDVSGNVSNVYSDTIFLLITGIDTLISFTPDQITSSQTAVFRYISSEPGAKFSYKIDSQPWSEWLDNNSIVFDQLELGNHYFFVKSFYDANADGEVADDEIDNSPATFSWTIVQESELYGSVEEAKVTDWYNY